jgi:carboxyl-terminal processing protease
MRPNFRPAVVFSVACFALGASGCSSSGAVNGFLSGIELLLGFSNEVEEVRAYMQDWYWWRDQAPQADVSSLETAEQALEALRYQAKDRYSYVEKASTYNAFFRSGTSVAFGIAYRPDPSSLVIRLIQANSPAAAAGLKRGDQITAIDAVSISQLTADMTLSAAFGASSVGVTRTFTVISPGSAARDVTIVKGEFALQHVLANQVSTPARANAGYLYLGAFTDQTNRQWRDALAPMVSNGVQRYVVDLRYNGGGTLSSALQVATSLAPQSADNQLFSKLSYNRFHSRSNYDFRFSAAERLANAIRIAFIVDAGTCSASEALIQGLKPFAEVALIGNTTCGKPVGFTPQLIADGEKVLNAVDFELANANGETDYFNGLTPTCRATDDLSKALGDPTEAMHAAALYWLDNGVCQVSASALGATSKSTNSAPAPSPPWRPRSTLEYFGIH